MKISIERLLLFVIAVGVSVIAVELLPTYRKDRIYNLCIEHEKLENHLRSSFYFIRNHEKHRLSESEIEFYKKRQERHTKKINKVLWQLDKEFDLVPMSISKSPEPLFSYCKLIRNSKVESEDISQF